MFGMFGEDHDCTTQVEDYRLDNAGDYLSMVSSGLTKNDIPVPTKGYHKDTDGFELFYGVKNDPNYQSFKEHSLLSGLGDDSNSVFDIPQAIQNIMQKYPDTYGNWVKFYDDNGNVNYRNKYTKAIISAATFDLMRSGNMSGLGCGADCDCPCNKNKGVSGLRGDLGPNYGAWPPGPKPEPFKWKDPNGETYTRTLLDGKWMYQLESDPRLYISASNLYDQMGVKKDANLLAISPIPGSPEPVEKFDWKHWKIGNYGAGWVILGALGLYSVLNVKNKTTRKIRRSR